MSVKVNAQSKKYAIGLANEGLVDKDSEWFFSAEDENTLAGEDKDDWLTYAKWKQRTGINILMKRKGKSIVEEL